MAENAFDEIQFSESLKHREWLKVVQWHQQVDSTNTVARAIATKQPEELPALIVAEKQTHGRGRSHHSWWSPRGCMMMTLAVPSTFLPSQRSQWSQLALIVGVGLSEAVESICPELTIQLKWPNDLYLNGRKAAGILIESFVPSQGSLVFLIGIGVNFDIDWRLAPEELVRRATCLSSETKSRVKLLDILPATIDSLVDRLGNWSAGHSDWHAYWLERCYLKGRNVAVRTPAGTNSRPNGDCSGRCEGVAADGQLLLRTDLGNLVPFSVGEIQLLD